MISPQSIEQLNDHYTVPDAITFEQGEGGLSRAVLTGQGATAHVYTLGAHVTHYQPVGHVPVLWMSSRSEFEPGKPIRGGVPICLPWFGAREDRSDLPNHGFARTSIWQVINATQTQSGDAVITLVMTDNEQTRELWPYAFEFRMVVSLGTKLCMALTVSNRSEQQMTITQALHSYFNVGDVRQVSVTGLEGAGYISKVQQQNNTQDGPITIESETDRVYTNTQAACTLEDPVLGRCIVIEKTGSDSTVVWNPWIDKSKAMSDFGDDEWPGMLCVETANALEDAICLEPGATHTLCATINSARQ
jgi:glucose-6-phosphate 1-epimerase